MLLSERPFSLQEVSGVVGPADALWSVRRRWPFVAAAGAVGLLVGLCWAWLQGDRYTSEATLRFIPPQLSERVVVPNVAMEAEQRTFALAQMVQSSVTASRLVRQLNLYPERRQLMPSVDVAPLFQESLQISRAGSGDNNNRSIPTLQIRFTYHDAGKAREVVQKLVELVYEENQRYRGDQSIGASDFLDKQARELAGNIADVERRMSTLGMADRSSGDHQWALRVQNLHNLEGRVRDTQQLIRETLRMKEPLEAKLRTLEQQYRRSLESAASAEENVFVETPEGRRLRADIVQTKETLALLEDRYQPNYHRVVAARRELEQLEARLPGVIAREREVWREKQAEPVRKELEHARAELAGLNEAINRYEQEAARHQQNADAVRARAVPSNEHDEEYLSLSRQYADLKKMHAEVVERQQQSHAATEMEQRGQGETLDLIDPPTWPARAAFPNAWVKTAIATAMGMLLGMAMAAGVYFHRPVLRTARHLQLWPATPLLAQIPLVAGTTHHPRLLHHVPVRGLATALLVLALTITTACGKLGDTPSMHVARGQQFEQHQDFDRASLSYQRAIAKDRLYAPAWERLALLQVRVNQPEAARQSLLRATELLPERADLLERLVSIDFDLYFADPSRPATLLREVEDNAATLERKWPGRTHAYRMQAEVFMERRRWPEAEQRIALALQRSGDQPELRLQQASLFTQTGRAEEALSTIEALLTRHPAFRSAWDMLYLQLSQQARFEDAQDVLARKWRQFRDTESYLQLAAHLHAFQGLAAAEQHTASVDLRVMPPTWSRQAGDFWFYRGELSRAEGAWRIALSRSGNDAELIGRLAELELSRRNPQAAKQHIELALRQRPDDAVLLGYQAALRLDSDRLEARQSAMRDLESILSRLPGSPFVRFHLGRARLRAGDIARAGQLLEQCVRLDPNYAPGWVALAEAELAQGAAGRAEARMTRFEQVGGKWLPALLLKARAQLTGRRTEQASQTISEILRLQPTHVQGRLMLVEMQLGSGQYRDALQQLDQYDGAFAEAAQEAAARNLRLQAAAQALARTDAPLALQEFDRLLLKQPNEYELQLGRAGALALLQKGDEAESIYSTLRKRQPNDARPWLALAGLWREQRHLDRAARAYREALRREPDNVIALNDLAMLLPAQHGAEAARLARRAFKLQPRVWEIADTLLQLSVRSANQREASEMLLILEGLQKTQPARQTDLAAVRRAVNSGDWSRASRILEKRRS
jgi:polysaccharide biosynthesis transport protein